jgi:hypothetical protein
MIDANNNDDGAEVVRSWVTDIAAAKLFLFPCYSVLFKLLMGPILEDF